MFMIALFLVFNIFSSSISSLPKNDFEEDVSKIQQVFNEINEVNAPKALKDIINERDDDNSHWCCKVNPPVDSWPQTFVNSYNQILSATNICGYTGCGLWGWSSCEVYCTNYWQETRYYIDQYTVYQQQQCPDSQIICCADYIFVLGHCLHLMEITNNFQLLQQLQQQGIVIPGLVGK